jgi:hypothetical protein
MVLSSTILMMDGSSIWAAILPGAIYSDTFAAGSRGTNLIHRRPARDRHR